MKYIIYISGERVKLTNTFEEAKSFADDARLELFRCGKVGSVEVQELNGNVIYRT